MFFGEKELAMGKTIRLEMLFDLFLILLGIVIVVVSFGYGFGSLRRPGPGLYPFFIGVAVLVLSLFVTILELRSKTDPHLMDRGGIKTFVLMIVTFCLWILIMPLLGYVIVTLLATFAFCKIMKLEGWGKPLAVSVGTAFFIYLLFDYMLYIDLPRGILE
jgi:putative tricarboxylic transport membrane protein